MAAGSGFEDDCFKTESKFDSLLEAFDRLILFETITLVFMWICFLAGGASCGTLQV